MQTEQATLSRIIGAIGDPGFAAVAAEAVSGFMAFELTAIVLHRPQAGAAVMFDNFDRAGGRRGLETYVAVTHRLNPILAARQGWGAFRARDFAIRPQGRLAQDQLVRAADEELGFRTVGWPERLEEVGLYFEACGGVVELGCYRARGRTPTDRIEALDGLCEPIAAAFERHARLTRAEAPAMEALSARERDVAELLLAGCGSEAIGLRLGISRHTVKDHRKQIFRKLRVGSLAELFALGRRGAAVN
jgi:DNA-binding CsgD family transcriptional regulator